MRYFIFALFLVAWPIAGETLSETERALLEEQRLWTIVSESSMGLTSYFEEETKRLLSERDDLTAERADLAQERASLETERQRSEQERSAIERLRTQLDSEQKQIVEDSKRIDEREKRVVVLERMKKAVPWLVAGVFVAGAVAWEAIDPD